MINPGKYRYKIKIVEDSTEKVDGFKTEVEKLIHTTYAQVLTTRGYTVIKSGTDFEKTYTSFTIRFTKREIHQGMFVKFKGRKYQIVYVNNINERDEEIELETVLYEKN